MPITDSLDSDVERVRSLRRSLSGILLKHKQIIAQREEHSDTPSSANRQAKESKTRKEKSSAETKVPTRVSPDVRRLLGDPLPLATSAKRENENISRAPLTRLGLFTGQDRFMYRLKGLNGENEGHNVEGGANDKVFLKQRRGERRDFIRTSSIVQKEKETEDEQQHKQHKMENKKQKEHKNSPKGQTTNSWNTKTHIFMQRSSGNSITLSVVTVISAAFILFIITHMSQEKNTGLSKEPYQDFYFYY